MCISQEFLIGLLLVGAVSSQSGYNAYGCPDFPNDTDLLATDKFIALLTDPCRYDKFARPANAPLPVNVQIGLTHLESSLAQFTAYMVIQYEYVDPKLKYDLISPNRTIVIGEEFLEDKIWTPNILVKDENDTTVITSEKKDVIISIHPSGTIFYSHRMKMTFYCWLNLRKFPFDSQSCTLALSDWTYNSNDLILKWNDRVETPFKISGDLHFTEYVLDSYSYTNVSSESLLRDNLVGNFTELIITFKFHRDVGYYALIFFIPSILLVCTAWVTFWLQADAGPPRATLGASTVIAFVTLHLGISKEIPKVSYVKASDIWFLGVSFFIFTSLAEFAFVNVIWRRKKTIELKKPNSKHIFKSAVMPRIARNDLRKYESTLSLWTTDSYTGSNTELNRDDGTSTPINFGQNNLKNGESILSIPGDESPPQFSWETMTPQELAIWVDRKARIVFPILFLIFNILYWTFVFVL